MALGSTVSGDDARWLLECPGGSAGRSGSLQLRTGMRGRRTLARGKMEGRTFEWMVTTLEDQCEVHNSGGPIWVAREITTASWPIADCSAFQIIGRKTRMGGGHTGPSSPALLWRAIEKECGGAPKQNALACCGLIHPKVQALLSISNESVPTSSLAGSRKGLSQLKEGAAWTREVARAADVAFTQAMESISSDDPKGVFSVLLQRPTFQMRFLPLELREGLSDKARREALLSEPFVRTFVNVYHKLTSWRAKRQHLSMFAPHYPFEVGTLTLLRPRARAPHPSPLIPHPSPLTPPSHPRWCAKSQHPSTHPTLSFSNCQHLTDVPCAFIPAPLDPSYPQLQ